MSTICQHVFTSIGCTFLLSESDTFPEKNYGAFDLYTCREYPDNYTNIYYYLVEQITKDSTMQMIGSGILILFYWYNL